MSGKFKLPSPWMFDVLGWHQQTYSQLLTKEMKHVRQIGAERSKFYKDNNFSDEVIGIDLLNLFVVDLLGRNSPTAKIFASKVEKE